MENTKTISAESYKTFKYLKEFFVEYLKLLIVIDVPVLLDRELEIVRDFTEEKLSKQELEDKFGFTSTRLNQILRRSLFKLLKLVAIAQKALEEKKGWNAKFEAQNDENFKLSEIIKKLKSENYRLKNNL